MSFPVAQAVVNNTGVRFFEESWLVHASPSTGIQTGTRAMFGVFFTHTLEGDPNVPAALPTPDTDESLGLRQDDIRLVLNNFGTLMRDSLGLYLDKGGDIAMAQQLDANEVRFTNLGPAATLKDLVTKSQMESQIP